MTSFTPHCISRTVVYGIAIQNGNLLVIKQKKGPFAGKYDLPGGKIEPNETIEEALRREFCEEVSLTFDSFQLIGNGAATTQVAQIGASYAFHQIGLFYQVTGLTPLSNPQPELESFWINLDELSTLSLSPLLSQSLTLLLAIHQ